MNSCDFLPKTDNEEYEEESSNRDTALGNSKHKMRESQSNTLIQDSKFDMTSPIKHREENKNEKNEKEDNNNSINLSQNNEIKKMSKEEIDILVDNRKSTLDLKIFDLVTKNQIEEKKVEELYENEENEEEKARLLKELEELIKRNEDTINEMKE